MSKAPALIQLEAVSKRFVKPLDLAGKIANMMGANNRSITVHAVDRVTFDLEEGEIVGLVGESGCGKSTVGRLVAGIHEPSDGRVLWHGADVASLPSEAQKAYTLGVQMIFQDPMASLNPRMRAGDIIGEAPVVHGLVARADRDDAVAAALARVGLDSSYARRYPHQFSGGQRARIGIARALAVNPKVLVCDESVAALDVSIQAQVLNLFMDLRESLDLTYLFISHNLSVVRHLSDDLAIMYLGRIIESAPSSELFSNPQHPYSKALLSSNLTPEVGRGLPQIDIGMTFPDPANPPAGCAFHPRCPEAVPACSAARPALLETAPGHEVACSVVESRRQG